jgi:hypothetical protein
LGRWYKLRKPTPREENLFRSDEELQQALRQVAAAAARKAQDEGRRH